MVAAARQSMSLMLSGIRNAPVSHNHMRVLEIVGEDATTSRQRVVTYLTQEPSTSTGIYSSQRSSATPNSKLVSARKRPATTSIDPMMSDAPVMLQRTSAQTALPQTTRKYSLFSSLYPYFFFHLFI